MKYFVHEEADAKFAVDRCYFEADHGRAALAIERLRDLLSEIPGNPHVLYAEGMVRRDRLGQGALALAAFRLADERARGDPRKADTARLAAYNAAMLAPGAPECLALGRAPRGRAARPVTTRTAARSPR